MANSALVVGSSQIFNGTWDIQGELLQTWYLMVEYKMRLNMVCWLGQSRFWKKNCECVKYIGTRKAGDVSDNFVTAGGRGYCSYQ
jgi:hypothetical protein